MFPTDRQTPKPRPPALLRRSPPKAGLLSPNGASPPPYALEFPSLQDGMEGNVSDPLAATAKMMGIELDTALDISHLTEQDISNKSKAELTDLFLQAEKIIKAREQELNVAANLGKSLLETNEALKLRHDTLLARLPVIQPSTSSTSNTRPPGADAWTTDDDVPLSSATLRRIHSCASSIASITNGSPGHSRNNSIISSRASASRGRVPRISASPSALLALSETNAELIAELTRLYNTTDAAQVEGAQRLRKLEREIGALKAELEETQRTNAELEEKVKEKVDEDRKREREERLRRLRGGDDRDADGGASEEIRDFAPQGSGLDKWASVPVTPRLKRVAPPVPSESDPEPSEGDAPIASAPSIASSRPASEHATDRGEYAVVAQLYRKVLELQEANADLTARNRITNKQLARAEREALEIKKLYKTIDEELAADSSEQEYPSAGTIRASPRGTGNFSSKSNSWSFGTDGDPFLDDKGLDKERSYGSLESKVLHHGVRAGKTRTPLTDALFSPPPSNTPSKPGKTPPSVMIFPSSPHSKSKLKPKLKGKAKPQTEAMQLLSPVSTPVPNRKFSNDSNSSQSSRSSMASSLLNLPMLRDGRRNRGRRSLGSELGSEFGDDWEGDMPEKRDSLFGDGSVRALSEGESDTGMYADTEVEDAALAALRDALFPPLAGRLLDQDEHILPVGSLQSTPGDTFHLVARAVTSRPTRWLEADDRRVRGVGPRPAIIYVPPGEDPWETTRYPDIEPGAETAEDPGSVRTRRRKRAIGRIVSTAHSRTASSSQLQTTEDASPPQGLLVSIKRTSADALIEVWIFLQFVIVICTFLYTMGKRGPREVLGAPPRRT